MEKENKKLKIAVISFDWRNIFENNFDELVQKLKRDRLKPDFNDFFFISWSSKKYHKKVGNIETVHLKAPFGARIFCDLLSDILVPIILGKYNFKPDIILVYDFPLIFSGIFPKIFWRSKVVLFLGNLPSALVRTRNFSDFRYYYQKISEFSGKHIADQFFVISESTKKYVVDLGVSAEKIKMITPDIIERDKEFILASQKGIIRKKYNIADDKKIMLSVGRLEPEKGFPELIKLFSRFKREDLVLIIVGQGSQESNLIRLVKELKIENKVIFAGYVDREKIWYYYQDANLFILLSLSEGLGLTFWEAMYMGVPVIGRKIDGILETIGRNEERGFLWQSEDGLEKLVQKVDFSLGKDENIESKKAQARFYVEDKMAQGDLINEF